MQYGMGYVEFLSLKKEIEGMLSSGYRFAAIYRELVSRKKITMSYTTFSRYVSGRYLKDGKKGENALLQPGNSATAALPAAPRQASVPATADSENIQTKSGPKKAAVEKKIPFGEEKFDLDKDIYGCKED